MTDSGSDFLADSITEFRKLKGMAERALAQLSDDEFFRNLGPESNPPAIIVKHMAGNMRSRWTDFLASDGEKPDRNRDSEFELGPDDSREALMGRWEAGWSRLFGALEPLTPGDLARVVPIRHEPHTVTRAVIRQLTHYGYHVGQIAQLARHYRGEQWQTLSIARGRSGEFNAEMARKSGESPR